MGPCRLFVAWQPLEIAREARHASRARADAGSDTRASLASSHVCMDAIEVRTALVEPRCDHRYEPIAVRAWAPRDDAHWAELALLHVGVRKSHQRELADRRHQGTSTQSVRAELEEALAVV